MRAIDIKQLKEGMRIAKTIYDDAGRILLNAGTVLTSLYIKKLDQFGIPFIYIEDEIVGPLQVEDVIHDTVRIQTVKALREVVDKAKIQSDIDFTVVSNMVNKILDDLKSTPNLLVQLMDSRSANMYLYNHSVGVCVLSVITGMALGLDELKLKTLGMGAILHDIGKTLSPGPEHTIHGFEILRNNKILNIMVGHVAYQHHEKYDGTGYPRQLKGEDIHLFAAITGVSNFYDNLVTNLNPEKRLYPYQAIELVVAESGRSFHPEIVKAFSRNIAPYPVGTAVRLNNGAVGVVVSVPRNYPTRPVVKIVTNHVGMLLTTFPEVDLLQERTLFINEILSEKERQEIL
ncbi:MAG: HD-GYP domain-containing protein [Bacillota bacterium]|uniref:HD domain-containing protein n=1 Tax=Thermanaerosceptrum fracticalcis TaxID=1712410 RepID=A0A7G6E5Y4_THEFR|nr:HD domain-containing phosphohydrolase [Thermanaerosceptrum fracticalcis]QNB47488.1 HD domain-containing protein [Thermanaerosceptrum fracticalcis]